MKIGRRKTLIFSMILFIFSCAVTQYLAIWTLLTGRILQGFSIGIFGTVCTRYTEETIPAHLMSRFGAFYQVISVGGFLAANLMAEILPDDDDKEALKKTERWRIIYAYFPIGFSIIILTGLVFVVKEDSIKFLILKNKVK